MSDLYIQQVKTTRDRGQRMSGRSLRFHVWIYRTSCISRVAGCLVKLAHTNRTHTIPYTVEWPSQPHCTQRLLYLQSVSATHSQVGSQRWWYTCCVKVERTQSKTAQWLPCPASDNLHTHDTHNGCVVEWFCRAKLRGAVEAYSQRRTAAASSVYQSRQAQCRDTHTRKRTHTRTHTAYTLQGQQRAHTHAHTQ